MLYKWKIIDNLLKNLNKHHPLQLELSPCKTFNYTHRRSMARFVNVSPERKQHHELNDAQQDPVTGLGTQKSAFSCPSPSPAASVLNLHPSDFSIKEHLWLRLGGHKSLISSSCALQPFRLDRPHQGWVGPREPASTAAHQCFLVI